MGGLRQQARVAAMIRTMPGALLLIVPSFAAPHGYAQTSGDRVRLLSPVAQMTPSGKPLRPEEQVDRVYEATSLREAQAAERARHQDAMEEIKAFQKRARERYNDDTKRCRDGMDGGEADCMRAAAARHRQASGESQRLHRREMDLYNHNLAIINRLWAPETKPRGEASVRLPQPDVPELDARSRLDALSWARAEARAAQAERRAFDERDRQERERLLERQRAFERMQREAQQR
jgi:hypothetical protein